MIAPPYTSDFVQLFLPILENESIAGTIKTEGEHDPVTEFIGKSHLFLAYLLPFCICSNLQIVLLKLGMPASSLHR